MKRSRSTIVLLLVFIAGLCLLLYPGISDWWNSFNQSRAVASYVDQVTNLTNEDYERMLKEARSYNQDLLGFSNRYHPTDAEHERYLDTLNVTDDGIMCYVEIPSIRVSLPVYHGVDDAVLQVAIGHIEGSSLPVGGASTHCVISGHRGLPSAELFSNIDQLIEGDHFMLQTLGETLTYEVDQIRIVEPDELDDLEIEEGRDLCTLVTCTPYGVNTHRLLVRGHRVANDPDAIRVDPDARQIDPVYVAPFVAAPIIVLLLVALLMSDRRRKKRRGTDSPGGDAPVGPPPTDSPDGPLDGAGEGASAEDAPAPPGEGAPQQDASAPTEGDARDAGVMPPSADDAAVPSPEVAAGGAPEELAQDGAAAEALSKAAPVADAKESAAPRPQAMEAAGQEAAAPVPAGPASAGQVSTTPEPAAPAPADSPEGAPEEYDALVERLRTMLDLPEEPDPTAAERLRQTSSEAAATMAGAFDRLTQWEGFDARDGRGEDLDEVPIIPRGPELVSWEETIASAPVASESYMPPYPSGAVPTSAHPMPAPDPRPDRPAYPSGYGPTDAWWGATPAPGVPASLGAVQTGPAGVAPTTRPDAPASPYPAAPASPQPEGVRR